MTQVSPGKAPGLAQEKTSSRRLALLLGALALAQLACLSSSSSTGDATSGDATSGAGDTGSSSTSGASDSSSTSGGSGSTGEELLPGTQAFNDSFAVLNEDGGMAQIGASSVFVQVHSESDGRHEDFSLGYGSPPFMQIVQHPDGTETSVGSHALTTLDWAETVTHDSAQTHDVYLEDTNADGIEDLRITRVFTLGQNQLDTTVEHLALDGGSDGGVAWVITLQQTGAAHQKDSASDDPNSPGCNSLKNADPRAPNQAIPTSSTFHTPTGSRAGVCSPEALNRLSHAINSALGDGLACLGKMRPDDVGKFWHNLNEHLVVVSCDNRCAKVPGETEQPQEHPPGDPLAMNIATGDSFNQTDEGLAETVLHEFEHLAGQTHLHLDDGSDDPSDAVYSCAAFCEACISGLKAPSASACATCTNVADRQAYCGQKREVVVGPPPGVLPAATCHTYVGLVSHCLQELWKVTVDCNGTIDYSPQNSDYLCCNQCEKILDDAYYPDVDCDPTTPPGTVTGENCSKGPTCP